MKMWLLIHIFLKKIKSFVRNFSRKGLKKFFWDSIYIFGSCGTRVVYGNSVEVFNCSSGFEKTYFLRLVPWDTFYLPDERVWETKNRNKNENEKQTYLVRKEMTNIRRRKQKWRKNIEPENERSNERKLKIKEELNKNLKKKERKKKRSM
jgi:hypothetical protein